ncbi:FecCD family ABC transporter permease [Desulfurivibrio sp. C05AmB]|uniref:FecCD family ABC transporter permease n=1 Tax=Desulfurivibrio sp. C05AmB TaxID=3374371 RepID=UPI00376EA9D9
MLSVKTGQETLPAGAGALAAGNFPAGTGAIIGSYRRLLGFKVIILGGLLTVLTGLALFSLAVGSLPLSGGEILAVLWNGDASGRAGHVVWNIRLPRTVAALLAGSGLGLAGVVMQNVLRNPLASPFTIGVSQGAAFGAAFAIIILGAGEAQRAGAGVTIALSHLVVIAAFCGAVLAVSLIMLLASLRGITTEAVILAGVALSAFFGASTMLLQYFADDMQVAATVFWTFGDLGKAGWPENALMALTLTVSLLYFLLARWNFNALQWGDEVAQSLGVRVKRLRLCALLISALTVAVATSFLGIIGFIGLMAPHLTRLLVGGDYRFLVLGSALTGALLLLLSDLIARTVMTPVILPVGIVTSFAGAPLFFYLLIRRGRRS